MNVVMAISLCIPTAVLLQRLQFHTLFPSHHTFPPPLMVGRYATRKWALVGAESTFSFARPVSPACAPERFRLVLGLLLAAADLSSGWMDVCRYMLALARCHGLGLLISSDARNQLGFWSFRAQHDVLPAPFDTVVSLDRKHGAGSYRYMQTLPGASRCCGEPLMHANSFQRRAAPFGLGTKRNQYSLCSTRHKRRPRANFMHYLPITGRGEWMPWYGLNVTCRTQIYCLPHLENTHAKGQDTSILAKKTRAAETRCPGQRSDIPLGQIDGFQSAV